MENVAGKLKDAIGGLTEILIIGNITEVVNSFIGAGASLASIVALLIVMSVLNRKT